MESKWAFWVFCAPRSQISDQGRGLGFLPGFTGVSPGGKNPPQPRAATEERREKRREKEKGKEEGKKEERNEEGKEKEGEEGKKEGRKKEKEKENILRKGF